MRWKKFSLEPAQRRGGFREPGERRELLKKLSLVFMTILGVGAFRRAKPARAASKSSRDSGQELEGSWFLIGAASVDGSPPTEFVNLVTVARDGSVIASSSFPSLSTAHGTWIRTGNRKFEATAFYLRADENENFVGQTRVRARLTVNRTKDHASGEFVQEGFDLDGNLIRTIEGPAEARRIFVEPFDG